PLPGPGGADPVPVDALGVRRRPADRGPPPARSLQPGRPPARLGLAPRPRRPDRERGNGVLPCSGRGTITLCPFQAPPAGEPSEPTSPSAPSASAGSAKHRAARSSCPATTPPAAATPTTAA